MIKKIKVTDHPRLMEIWESSVLNTHDFLKEEDFLYYKEQLPVYFSLEKRMEAIWNLYKDNPRVKVMSYNQLTVDFAKEVGAGFILRGIRTVNDFEYEKTIADVNRKLTGIETFILFTEPEHTHISSSIVRELLRYGKDISQFVPKETRLY